MYEVTLTERGEDDEDKIVLFQDLVDALDHISTEIRWQDTQAIIRRVEQE